MEAVSKDVAYVEVNAWLDRMDVPQDVRDKDGVIQPIAALVKSLSEGNLIFNADETVTQVLKFPLADGATKEIVYDFRYEIGQYNKATKGISPTDEVDWSIARLTLVAANKQHTKGVFEKMKGPDFKIARNLTVFF